MILFLGRSTDSAGSNEMVAGLRATIAIQAKDLEDMRIVLDSIESDREEEVSFSFFLLSRLLISRLSSTANGFPIRSFYSHRINYRLEGRTG